MGSSVPSQHGSDPPAFGGIVIAGPVGSGKRTLTFALTSLRRSYAPFPPLTTAPRPTLEAMPATEQHLGELKAWAQIFHEFTDGGMRYVYDHERLTRLREEGRIPVASVGDIEGLQAFERVADDWLQILLWCPREVAERRLAAGSPPARHWDRSLNQLMRDPRRYALVIRSDRWNAVEAAQLVHVAAQSGGPRQEAAARQG